MTKIIKNKEAKIELESTRKELYWFWLEDTPFEVKILQSDDYFGFDKIEAYADIHIRSYRLKL